MRISFWSPALVSVASAQGLRSQDSEPRRSAGLVSRLPSVGSPPTRPGHPAPSSSRPRPLGRTVAFDPGWAADLCRQTGRQQGGPEGRRVISPPARALRLPTPSSAPPHLARPVAAPLSFRGREKVPVRPPPLKGAALPLPHPPQTGSALSPKHLSEAPKGLDFPSPPLAFQDKRGLGSKMDWTGGAGVRICPAGLLLLLLLLERLYQERAPLRSRLESPNVGASGKRPPLAAGWNAPLASAALGVPERWLEVSGLSSSQPAPLLSSSRFFSFAHPPPPTLIPAGSGPSAKPDRYLAVENKQASVIVISNKTAFSPKGCAFWSPL